MAVSGTRIELEIGELILHGFPAGDRHRIADAIRGRLEHALEAPQLRASLGDGNSIERLTLPSLRATGSPESFGARLGDALAAAVLSTLTSGAPGDGLRSIDRNPGPRPPGRSGGRSAEEDVR